MAESFTDRDLSNARFTRCDLSNARVRGSSLSGLELDDPWLLDEGGGLVVNGVDVTAFVDAELNRRFPGRAQRRAATPEELRSAWSAVERAWAGAVDRVIAMPPGASDTSIDGEWSFAQTLRHLVMATDVWLNRTVLDRRDPPHPIGVPNAEYASDGHDVAVFHETQPSFERVLAVRSEYVASVREFLDGVTAQQLEETRADPWAPTNLVSVAQCLRVILAEEWELLRYATRDLDRLSAEAGARPSDSPAVP